MTPLGPVPVPPPPHLPVGPTDPDIRIARTEDGRYVAYAAAPGDNYRCLGVRPTLGATLVLCDRWRLENP